MKTKSLAISAYGILGRRNSRSRILGWGIFGWEFWVEQNSRSKGIFGRGIFGRREFWVEQKLPRNIKKSKFGCSDDKIMSCHWIIFNFFLIRIINFHSLDKKSLWAKFPWTKIPFGRGFLGRKFLGRGFPLDENSLGEDSLGENSLGEDSISQDNNNTLPSETVFFAILSPNDTLVLAFNTPPNVSLLWGNQWKSIQLRRHCEIKPNQTLVQVPSVQFYWHEFLVKAAYILNLSSHSLSEVKIRSNSDLNLGAF